jgi:hypothetical protein
MLASGGITMPGLSFNGGGQERSVALELAAALARAGVLGGNPSESMGRSVSSSGKMSLVMLSAWSNGG